MKKFLFGLAPLLAVAMFAVVPSSALAHHRDGHRDGPCRVLVSWNALPAAGKCAEPPGVSAAEAQNLRDNSDGAGTTPLSTNFGTDGLLVNTKSEVKFVATIAKVALTNTLVKGYGLFGVKLYVNPENNLEKCRAATGAVPWVDLQNTSPSAVFNSFSAWSFTINSDAENAKKEKVCGTKAGVVTIRNVSLLFEQLGAGKAPVIASGTFVGKYSQPEKEKCPAGGVEIEPEQPGITTEPVVEKLEINNGVAGKGPLFCFVSANNYLFPAKEPKWEEFININKHESGIWKTATP